MVGGRQMIRTELHTMQNLCFCRFFVRRSVYSVVRLRRRRQRKLIYLGEGTFPEAFCRQLALNGGTLRRFDAARAKTTDPNRNRETCTRVRIRTKTRRAERKRDRRYRATRAQRKTSTRADPCVCVWQTAKQKGFNGVPFR